MTNTGIVARLKRISTGGRYLVVPMDHGISLGPITGLADIESTIDAVTTGGADAVLTQKGIAPRVHEAKNGAGYIAHLNASTSLGPAPNDKRRSSSVTAALQAGADAVSFHINVGSDYEPAQIEDLAQISEQAAEFGLPTLAMAYARGGNLDGADPEHDPEHLAHAVRLAEELGADVVKTAYSGDPDSFGSVVDGTRLPVVIAGGSKGTDRQTVEMVRGAMDAGAAGVSMGRSIFQHEDPDAITRAVSAVVHDDHDAGDALRTAGLNIEV